MYTHDDIKHAKRIGYEYGYKAAKDEIVRCKDCRHFVESGIYDGKAIHACTYMRTLKTPDNFCGYGRRKDDIK